MGFMETKMAADAIAYQSTPAIAFKSVTCCFPKAAGKRGSEQQIYTAVKDVSLEIKDGEFVSVVGPTGCGKSTLLNVAAGLIHPTEGVVDIFGTPLGEINRDAGYMFQAESLMAWRTALQNVTVGLEYRGVSSSEARARAMDWLAKVGLAGFEDRYPHQLSGGMRKRVSLAQMLVLDPRIVLLDEPFSALDAQTRVLMENELLALWAANRKSVLFITHDLEEAISMSDRVVVLSAGPATHPIAEFEINLPRPRDVSEIRLTEQFLKLHHEIWDVMKEEVLKGYAQSKR
ncbi:NitT/TauT family transport system ATP-binding protein [Nitrobacteraceae bacterium AZCC 1564]